MVVDVGVATGRAKLYGGCSSLPADTTDVEVTVAGGKGGGGGSDSGGLVEVEVMEEQVFVC